MKTALGYLCIAIFIITIIASYYVDLSQPDVNSKRIFLQNWWWMVPGYIVGIGGYLLTMVDLPRRRKR